MMKMININTPSDRLKKSTFNTISSILLLIIIIFFAASVNSVAIYVILLIYSQISIGHRINVMFILFFLSQGNNALFKPIESGIFHYITIAMLFLDSYILAKNSGKLTYHREDLYIVFLIASLMALNIFSSQLFTISFFKLLFFLLGILSIRYYSLVLSSNRYKTVDRFVEIFSSIVIISSIPFLFIAKIGFSINRTGFQGILGHPQSFGIFCLLFYIYYLNKFVFSKFDRSVFYLLMLTIISAFLFLSESRTALLSAIIISIIYFFTISPKISKIIDFRRKLNILIIALLTSSVLILLNQGIFVNNLQGFISKRSDSNGSNLLNAYRQSRGYLIDNSLKNFEDSPILGIGFGVSLPYDANLIVREPIFGLPISIPFEKGFVGSAILEENGILGTLIILSLLIFITRRLLMSKLSYIMLLGFIFSNFGEYTIFSLGSVGLLGWLMVCCSYHFDRSIEYDVSNTPILTTKNTRRLLP